jgi:hypothetical protein
MLAFAGNSLLCRLALAGTSIDAGTFTSVRIVSGALTLWIIVQLRRGAPGLAGVWASAAALFAYAAGFSLAYINLSAATGALLLFGAAIIAGVEGLHPREVGDIPAAEFVVSTELRVVDGHGRDIR